jgi:hypothetical protein
MVAGGDGVECLRSLEVEQGAIAEAPPRPFAAGG